MDGNLFGDLQVQRQPGIAAKAGPPKGPKPPFAFCWYGPSEIVYLVPHPFLAGQPYRLRPSMIKGVAEADGDGDQCFLWVSDIREPVLVGATIKSIQKIAPWAEDNSKRTSTATPKAPETPPP
jgi:hypothetical protein